MKFNLLWKGPFEDGVTFSLMSDFLVCRERFFLQACGLSDPEDFSAPMEFGNFFHVLAEEDPDIKGIKGPRDLDPLLKLMTTHKLRLLNRFSHLEPEINRWAMVAAIMYVKRQGVRRADPRTRKEVTVLTEREFRTPYRVPVLGSPNLPEMEIMLRGKIDTVFLVNAKSGFWIQDHKCKSDVDSDGIAATLARNLQLTIYATAFKELTGAYPEGVSYNVIQRPAIKPNSVKKETHDEYYQRLWDDVDKRPAFYFHPFYVTLRPEIVQEVTKRTLRATIQSIVYWWKWVKACEGENNNFANRFDSMHHFQFPWGVYNSLSRGFRGDYHTFLSGKGGSFLIQKDTLYPELENVGTIWSPDNNPPLKRPDVTAVETKRVPMVKPNAVKVSKPAPLPASKPAPGFKKSPFKKA